MLKTIKCENVRLFEGQYSFDLEPLTIFCGINSAGKSTIVKLPQILRQSQGIGESYEAEDGQLRLIGSQVDMGTFRSFISNNDVSKDIEIGITNAYGMPKSAIKLLRDLKAMDPIGVAFDHSLDNEYMPVFVSASYDFGINNKVQDNRKSYDYKGGEKAYLKKSYYEIKYNHEVLLSWSVGLIPSPAHRIVENHRYLLYMPVNFFKWAYGSERMDVEIPKDKEFVVLQTKLVGIMPQGIHAPIRQKGERKTTRIHRPTTKQQGIWPLPGIIEGTLGYLQKSLSEMHYLGPLRTEAKRFYVVQFEKGLDTTGEFLPFVLRDQADTIVKHCPPMEYEPKLEELERALNEWMFFIRSGSRLQTNTHREIAVSTIEDLLVEFSLLGISGQNYHSIVDSGFGYSQILPILVRGLLTPENSTLIVEQPELHLNPGLQVRLGGFFLSMALSGKQVILETHSEHIVNSIRVLAAESNESINAKIIYIESSQEGPVIHDLSIKEDGTIKEWPPGFFGEAADLRGRILRAQRR